MEPNSHNDSRLSQLIGMTMVIAGLVLFLLTVVASTLILGPNKIISWVTQTPKNVTTLTASEVWEAPALSQLQEGETKKLIVYGRELIVNTAAYLGPNGSVMAISNGMNCQNCHLDAGTKLFGNNYSAVASTYPKFRARSGAEESVEKRVNDCFERSLNGKALPEESNQMKAIVAYINWLGKDVAKGTIPKGSGLIELPFLDRSASIENGKLVYEQKCTVCHGNEGAGITLADDSGYLYPPLWGQNSYNMGAGLYRLSRFAGYVKANMPLGATFDSPQLTDEEAWDVAAYVNSLPRPQRDLSADWPNISQKPIDHPYGPYTDGFEEAQHKLGPFKPIREKQKELSAAK
ncbi:MAG: c-type cytochrome [Flammeovirgaceae bacterium]|jgi:thiosulfate dehydrogenase|nr:c-type cytochrome [Flammeovirgaceae bacterium]